MAVSTSPGRSGEVIVEGRVDGSLVSPAHRRIARVVFVEEVNGSKPETFKCPLRRAY